MAAIKRLLVVVFLCFTTIQSGASSWTVTLPSSVEGLVGSCVVIPCSYNYPDPKKTVSQFTGIWRDQTNQVIYHSDPSKTVQQYKTRTELVGDITRKDCSLKIDPLQQSDQGPFHFRIEIEGFDKYSYGGNRVPITMISESHPSLSVTQEVVEGHNVTASCSVSHSCPSSPPEFTWSHAGVTHLKTRHLNDGQWNLTSTLTFVSTRDNHNKPVKCTVTYKGGLKGEKASSVIKVKYAPVNVEVDHTSEVKQGEDVMLKCSSDANPPANYQWLNENNTLHQGQSYLLTNVSRHTGILLCAAVNTVGQRNSTPVHLNVLFPPEIRNFSCSSEGDKVQCLCTVESRPPSTVHFVLSDRVLLNTSTDVHGLTTIVTLQAESGSSESVRCVANNTLGHVNATFTLPSKVKMPVVYISIGIGAGACLLILFTVVVVIKCRGRAGNAETSDVTTKEEKAVELHYTTTKSGRPTHAPTPPDRDSEDKDEPDYVNEHYTDDPVYGNIEEDFDDTIYANT
ncbi:myelin-associated glycoprotein-like isoform X1 [Betta splendens]|uniref:Myelin-associated glycoprotein-like isoform X1 n=1 Tax=Betta splendens TaxID=158456 RepID=A0A8M1H641_BETSP|nr:myelin-associated glycoprotein-like isoform X1 [Betta splendens]